MLLLPDYFDASAATRGSWLHDVHVLEALHLPLIYPPFVIFREYVRGRCNVILLAVSPLHLENISPEVIFPTKMPCTGEMIDLLELVNVLQLVRFN